MVSSGDGWRLVARAAGFAIPPVAASPPPPVHGLWGLSFDPGQVEFSVAKLSTPEDTRCPEERGVLSPVSLAGPAFPEFSRRVGAAGTVKIACLAPLVALR